jgi:PKD repeat protein
VTLGALPPGLTLTPVTPRATKTVNPSGTPTTTGNYSFTITATGANGCQVSQAYTILVNPASCRPITEGSMLTALMRIVVRTAAKPVGGAPRCGGGAAPTADGAVTDRAPEAECWERTGV